MGILWVYVLQTSFLYHTGMTVQNPTLQLCSGNGGFSQPTSYPFSPKKIEHTKVLLRIRAFSFHRTVLLSLENFSHENLY